MSTVTGRDDMVHPRGPAQQRATTGSAAATAATAGAPVKYFARNARIVLVDDDAAVRGALGEFLVDLGFDIVGVAGDGLEGVTLVCELRPDAVLMDLHMPVTDGIVATARITAECPGIPVIIISAYDDTSLQAAAMHAGAFAYLLKGAPAAGIEQAVTAAVESTRATARGTSVSVPQS